MGDIKPEWAVKNAKNFDPTGTAATFHQVVYTINRFLGRGELFGEPAEDIIHLIVTAERREYQ